MATAERTEAADISYADAVRIWKNGAIPVVFQPDKRSSLLVRLPYGQGNREWLLGSGRDIAWQPKLKAWVVPRSRFNGIVDIALERFGECWMIQEYRPMEKCAPACWNAEGHVCQCSCLGANHGSRRELAHVVSETFAFERGGRKLACRLLKRRTS